MKFIGREQELGAMQRAWISKKAGFWVIWGKRRVGKTELVKQFIKDKPAIYYMAEETNQETQLKSFAQEVGKYTNDAHIAEYGFRSWQEALSYLKIRKQKIVLVFDEFPYLIQANSGVPSFFQKIWDHSWKDSNIFLILLGSSISMMETEVLGRKSPLYGRRTGQIRLQPFSFDECKEFISRADFDQRLHYYGLCGGIPAYWNFIGREKSFWANLEETVLNKQHMLYEEVEFILREELREPRNYFALLQAISLGKRKLHEITNSSGLVSSKAAKYLSVLCDLKIIEREVPASEEKPLKSKKGLYRVIDPFVNFWFKFVFPNRTKIEIAGAKEVAKDIKDSYALYLSYMYEEVSKQILIQNQKKLFWFDRIGRDWGPNYEIDLFAVNKKQSSVLFGEVKYTNKQVGINILNELKQKAQQVDLGGPNRKEYYIIFSKNGFTREMLSLVKKDKKLMLFQGERQIG